MGLEKQHWRQETIKHVQHFTITANVFVLVRLSKLKWPHICQAAHWEQRSVIGSQFEKCEIWSRQRRKKKHGINFSFLCIWSDIKVNITVPQVRPRASVSCVRLGPASLDESWVKADVSDVVPVQQPGQETLETKAVTAVRTRAVLPLNGTWQKFRWCFIRTNASWSRVAKKAPGKVFSYLISVPVVRGWVDALSLVALKQLVGIPDTHGASDNLTHIWHQNINLRQGGLFYGYIYIYIW